MYGGFLILLAIGVVALSPVIWGVWWLIADLGDTVSGRPAMAP